MDSTRLVIAFLWRLPTRFILDRTWRLPYKEFVTMTIPQMTVPENLPVFPLTGVLLLPGTILPLHIFEPRYRNMVEDALDADKIFGMIQPFAPQQDNRPLPGADKETPDLYKVGCAGYIEQCEKLTDGRIFIYLIGIYRFRFEEVLQLLRVFRSVSAIYCVFPEVTPAV